MISMKMPFLKLSATLLGAMAVLSGCTRNNTSAPASQTPETGATQDPSEMLSVGQKAPDFAVQDESGQMHRLSDYTGNEKLVLVFYPGDNTPGCTAQLCAIRDDWSQFQDSEVAVLGVNPAGSESHSKFAEKYDFPFPLLVDSEEEMIRAYGAQGAMGFPKRTVYAIDKDGVIVFAERGMPANSEILASLDG